MINGAPGNAETNWCAISYISRFETKPDILNMREAVCYDIYERSEVGSVGVVANADSCATKIKGIGGLCYAWKTL